MQCVLACMVHISNRMRKENRKHVANCCSTKQLSHFTFHAWPIHRKIQWKGINFNCSDVYLCCRFLSTAKAKCCIILSIACSLFFCTHACIWTYVFGMWPLLNCRLQACILHSKHNAHMVRIFEFSVYFFLENCNLNKITKWIQSKKSYWSTKINECASIKHTAVYMLKVGVWKYGIHFIWILGNGKVNGIR